MSDIRLSVNINAETAQAIRALKDRDGRTTTDIIRRAVSVLRFLENAQRERQQIRLVDRRGQAVDVKIL